MHGFMISTLRQAKRAIVVVVGFTVLLFGIVLIVLPGPAILVIPLGLAILATEFVWARKLLVRFKREADRVKYAASRVATAISRKPRGNPREGSE